jgi:hypothetical protein
MSELKNQMAADSEAPPEQTGSLENLMALAEEMEALKDVITEMDSDLKDQRKRYDEIRKALIPEEMERVKLVNDAGKGSFTLASGGKIHLTNDLFASYFKANEAAVFEWLKEQGHGDLIKQTVHPATLKAFAKEQTADGTTLPEELFNIAPFTYAKLVRRKT